MVVGFLHLEKKTLAEVERDRRASSTTTAGTSTRSVGDFYAADPTHKALQAEMLHAIEAGDNETARLAAHVAARIVDCHLATMGARHPLRPAAHESDILRLHFWDRAFELLKERARSTSRPRARTPAAGSCRWARATTRRSTRTRSSSARTAPSPTPARTSPTSSGSSGCSTATSATAVHRVDPDGHVLWTHAPAARARPGAPRFGHAQRGLQRDRRRPVLPAARGARPASRRSATREAAAASHHLAYEKVVLSPATARALGYDVSEDEAAVKVSGRKGLGVKADDLLDALDGEGARRDRRARPRARRRRRARPTARAIAVGALRYFLLKFGRNKIITFDMDEALAFDGETGPYIQNAVVRARNIFAQARGRGPRVAALSRARAQLDLGAFLTGEEGDEVWSLLLLMARSEEVVEQAVRAEEVALAGQARLRGGPGLPLLLPEAAVLAAARRERGPARLPRRWWSTPSSARWRRCSALLGHPDPGADVRRPAIGDHDRLRRRRAGLHALRHDYVRAVEQAAACRWCWPRASPRTRRRCSTALDGLVLSGGSDVDPALYGEAAPPEARDAWSASATSSSWRCAARRWRATCRSSLSAGASRC